MSDLRKLSAAELGKELLEHIDVKPNCAVGGCVDLWWAEIRARLERLEAAERALEQIRDLSSIVTQRGQTVPMSIGIAQSIARAALERKP